MQFIFLLIGFFCSARSFSEDFKVACEVRETKRTPTDCKLNRSTTRFESKLDEHGGQKRVKSPMDSDYRFVGSVTVFNKSENYLHAAIEYLHPVSSTPQNPYPIQFIFRESTAGREKSALYDAITATFYEGNSSGPNECDWKRIAMVCLIAKAEDSWAILGPKVAEKFDGHFRQL